MLKALEGLLDYGTAVIEGADRPDDAAGGGRDEVRSFRGQSTRARVVSFVMGHNWDIYGQMVVYLRMNGITPPASQRP